MNWLTDSIIRIKNAGTAGKSSVEVRGTKFCLNVFKALKADGFISDFALKEKSVLKQACEVKLAYFKDVPLIKKLKFVSTPKNRIYKQSDQLKKYVHSFKFALVSTNKGVMSAKDAIEANLGGELLFWMEN